MKTPGDTLTIVRAYHRGWSSGRFDEAFAALSDGLRVEVPINQYSTKASFTEAVARFAGMISSVELLGEFANERDAMLLYDMDVEGLGPFRVAEHFTVENGKITRIRQIHDTAMLRSGGSERNDVEGANPVSTDHYRARPVVSDFVRRLAFRVPRERVFAAIATLDALSHWWTPRVSGAVTVGGAFRLEFDGLDEHIDMRIDAASHPSALAWTCLAHTGLAEWNGTRITFTLVDTGDGECELRFRHLGLTPASACYDDCAVGWDHFLASLVDYVERGQGTPFAAARPPN